MEMSPREIVGRLHFAQKRITRERGEMLSIMAMGARGEWKAVKKRIDEMSKDT